MKGAINEIIFMMKDGRRIGVSKYGDSWCQYDLSVATKRKMLSPLFLEELWQLLHKWQMIEKD